MSWLICPQQKDPIPLYRRLGEPRDQSKQTQKILLILVFEPWTVKYVASCYTNYVILTSYLKCRLSQSDPLFPFCKLINFE